MLKKLRLFRHSMFMTQKDFAEKIGVAHSTYSNVEGGRMNGGIKFWRSLKQAFELTDEEIAALRENPAETTEE